MGESILQLQQIRKSFANTEVLKGIDLEAGQGEFITLLGASGCGKTTTLRIIAGLELPDSGQVILEGHNITDWEPNKRDVNTVFQNYALYPHLTVKQNILFPLQNLKGKDKLSRSQMDERAQNAARLVQITELMDRRPSELSGGQQQRVAIARALALHPDILCFDEPTSALDPELTGEVLRVLRDLADRKTTMIIVTHEMHFARDVADRILFMDGGVVVEEGPARQLIDHPQEERTKQFLAHYSE